MLGLRFGRLVVLATIPDAFIENGRARPAFECVCDCGVVKQVRPNNLRNGKTNSCGCLKRQMLSERRFKHGESHWFGKSSKEYAVWTKIRSRCECPTDRGFANYGGRGISVWPMWAKSFRAFLRDVGRAPTSEHSLDRINNDGNYEPGNVRWATRSQQVNNRRRTVRVTFDGVTRPAADWDRELGYRVGTVWQRLRIGWTVEQALTIPLGSTACRRPVAA